MRVLLMHSEPLTGNVLAATLLQQGYDVAQAATTQEAVLRCARRETDIVFLDVRAAQTSVVTTTVKLLRDANPALFIICPVDGDSEAFTPGALCLRRLYSVWAIAELFRALFEQTAGFAGSLSGEAPQPAVLSADDHDPDNDAANPALLHCTSCAGPSYSAQQLRDALAKTIRASRFKVVA